MGSTDNFILLGILKCVPTTGTRAKVAGGREDDGRGQHDMCSCGGRMQKWPSDIRISSTKCVYLYCSAPHFPYHQESSTNL